MSKYPRICKSFIIACLSSCATMYGTLSCRSRCFVPLWASENTIARWKWVVFRVSAVLASPTCHSAGLRQRVLHLWTTYNATSVGMLSACMLVTTTFILIFFPSANSQTLKFFKIWPGSCADSYNFHLDVFSQLSQVWLIWDVKEIHFLSLSRFLPHNVATDPWNWVLANCPNLGI